MSDEIAKSEDGVINLTRDYGYGFEDHSEIIINKTITINGNNHRINANSQSRIFTINNGNVILNDIILENGNSTQGGAIFTTKPMTLNNVVFKSNNAIEGGAVYSKRGIDIKGSIFDGNTAENGAAIYLVETPIDGLDPDEAEALDTYNITDSIFKNSHNITKGLLYIDTAYKIRISYSTFANSTAEYGTAIFSPVGCELEIIDDLFENLHSTKSGGVFLFDNTYKITIEKSKFINDSSDTIGGVLCCILGDSGFGFEFDLIIKSSEFRNSKAKFGGVITQFEGRMTIEDSIFDNNTAISGGAVYAASCKQTIKNSTFTNNRLLADFNGSGGAVYSFSKSLKIDNSMFANNTANAVYCAENQLTVTNSYFKNNTNAIQTAYDKKRTLKNNSYNGDKLALNHTEGYYVLIINSTGLPLMLTDTELNITGLPSRYDSRDYGWVTSVKNQETSGA